MENLIGNITLIINGTDISISIIYTKDKIL